MKNMDVFDDIYIDVLEDDDLEEIDIIHNGIPRKIYNRSNFFETLDDLTFYQRFRLTKNTTLQLLALIDDRLEYFSDKNNSVSPINQLLTSLRFYATCGHLTSVADFSGMHYSTVSRIVVRVSEAIASLGPQFIKFPRTAREIQDSQNAFFNIAGFPRVIGALDCTHVKVQSPGGEDAEVYRNRKSYFSFNVQAVCNANLEIINIVARWPGSSHDSTIFNSSALRAEFEDNRFANSLLLGDSGYPLRPYLLTPFLNPANEAQQLYNQSHIRTRNIIERTFGVWKRRFPVLAYGCRLKTETVMTIIVATAVLHNITRLMYEEINPPAPDGDINELEQLILDGQIPNLPNPNEGGGIGAELRNNFVRNFFARL